jgi:Fungal chitosanase of glycosyl hydrolase group 75
MPECAFEEWTQYRGINIRRLPDRSAYLYVTARQSVDADGAPNAYHPDDVNGGACPDSGTGLECPANAGYRSNHGVGNSSWWRSVLVPDPANPDVAYRQPDGEWAGYFVSQTALQRLAEAGPLSPRSYVDASTVPFVVMPGDFYAMPGTGRMGDIGYALNLANGRYTPFVFADVGPDDARLGEASIAFWQALGGNNPNPRNGAGVPGGSVAYLVFPRSSTQVDLDWPIDPDRLRAAVAERLGPLGGEAAVRACVD